jgi:dTDP-4-dehydrorhamnose reductase
MLLNQMKAVVLSMKAIKKINPGAKLVQTEDLGKTFSAPSLQYQANIENERRWLTNDLLCGMIKPGHAMWDYFMRLGISEASLNFFIDNTCPPDIIGFNYYITSERYLDDNIKNYPSITHGGNELQVYADVEAVRVPHGKPSGLSVLLKEAWERYKLPMAITEVHLNCGREDQKRWFKEVWDTCLKAVEEGIDIRAITAWSLFGAFGWDKLLTSKSMNYEPGVFDLRSGTPRPTALASLIKSLISSQEYEHPLLEEKGWWHRDIRFIYDKNYNQEFWNIHNNSRPILIFGKRGTLGKAFAKICSLRCINHKLLSREEVNLTQVKDIEKVIKEYNPWAVINAAGYVKVDDAEKENEKCFNDNCNAAKYLAKVCKNYGVQLITFSSDLVFDGKKKIPYVESDAVNPLNIYGKSKAQAEVSVLQNKPDALIIRTSAFFGPWDEYNFVHDVIKTLSENRTFIAADDVIISPTYVPDLVNACLDLLIDDEKGIWHITNSGEISWFELAKKVALKAHLDVELIEGRPVDSLNLKARRPNYGVLKSEKGIILPSLDNALRRYFYETKTIPAWELAAK